VHFFPLLFILRYFHRTPRRVGDIDNNTESATSAGGYRGGTRKGLDLTLGGPTTSPYFTLPSDPSDSNSPKRVITIRGGILLRTVRRVSDSKIISGPSLLVDEILRLSKVSSIPELVDHKWDGNLTALPQSPNASSGSTDTFLRLRLKSDTHDARKPHVYRSPRIGLELSHPSTTNSITDPRVIYVSKPYRYFIHPDLLTSNGRFHTFLGIYRACRDSGKYTENNNAKLLREVGRVAGLKEKTVDKYFESYQSGYGSGNLDMFVGAKGKGASSSPSMCLMMMGTLEKLLG
jgi:hypothetical protein